MTKIIYVNQVGVPDDPQLTILRKIGGFNCFSFTKGNKAIDEIKSNAGTYGGVFIADSEFEGGIDVARTAKENGLPVMVLYSKTDEKSSGTQKLKILGVDAIVDSSKGIDEYVAIANRIFR